MNNLKPLIMNKLIVTLILSSMFAVVSFAQELKIITVDMGTLYSGYYKTKEANEKLKDSIDQAQSQAEELLGEGRSLAEEFNNLRERINNPALTDEFRNKAKLEAQEKLKEIQDKEREIQQYQANTERSLQQRQRTHRDLMLDEIKKVVLKMAEKRGAALVFDTAGTSALGIPNVLYSNPRWDITDDVLVKINESAPSE